MQYDIKDLRPTKGFEAPPYHVEAFPGHGVNWYAVINKNGFNCLNFPRKPGAKFTLELETANQICKMWNDAYNKAQLKVSAPPTFED